MTRYYVMELKEVQKGHFNVSFPMSLSGGGHMDVCKLNVLVYVGRGESQAVCKLKDT